MILGRETEVTVPFLLILSKFNIINFRNNLNVQLTSQGLFLVVGCDYHTQSSAVSFEKYFYQKLLKMALAQGMQANKMTFFLKKRCPKKIHPCPKVYKSLQYFLPLSCIFKKILILNLEMFQSSHHIDISQLIITANQLTISVWWERQTTMG